LFEPQKKISGGERMIMVDTLDLTANCSDYQTAMKSTSKKWIRNSLTGQLYQEETGIDGGVIRYHVIEVVVDSDQRDALMEKYKDRAAVTFTSDDFQDKSCIIVEDELRLSKIPGADAYTGTIAFEEITKIN
jgi:hypothetical protein